MILCECLLTALMSWPECCLSAPASTCTRTPSRCCAPRGSSTASSPPASASPCSTRPAWRRRHSASPGHAAHSFCSTRHESFNIQLMKSIHFQLPLNIHSVIVYYLSTIMSGLHSAPGAVLDPPTRGDARQLCPPPPRGHGHHLRQPLSLQVPAAEHRQEEKG